MSKPTDIFISQQSLRKWELRTVLLEKLSLIRQIARQLQRTLDCPWKGLGTQIITNATVLYMKRITVRGSTSTLTLHNHQTIMLLVAIYALNVSLNYILFTFIIIYLLKKSRIFFKGCPDPKLCDPPLAPAHSTTLTSKITNPSWYTGPATGSECSFDGPEPSSTYQHI